MSLITDPFLDSDSLDFFGLAIFITGAISDGTTEAISQGAPWLFFVLKMLYNALEGNRSCEDLWREKGQIKTKQVKVQAEKKLYKGM